MANFTDNFNRANGGVGSNWTTLTGMSELQVTGNICNANANPSGGHVATATATFAADQEAQAVVAAFGSFDRPGPGVRLSGNNGYVARVFGATEIGLHRMDAGVLTALGAGVAYAVGDTVRIRAESTTISLFVNDVELRTQTDATYSTGQPGIYYDRGNLGATHLDDFYATDLGGPAGATVVVTANGDIQ